MTNTLQTLQATYQTMFEYERMAYEATTEEDRRYAYDHVSQLMKWVQSKREKYGKLRNKTEAEIMENIPF